MANLTSQEFKLEIGDGMPRHTQLRGGEAATAEATEVDLVDTTTGGIILRCTKTCHRSTEGRYPAF